jgi:hypothetical protein
MSARKKVKKSGSVKLTSDQLRRKLKLKHIETKEKLLTTYPKAKDYFRDKNIDPGKVREQSAKIIGAGAIAGALILNPPTDTKALPSPTQLLEKFDVKGANEIFDPTDTLVQAIKSVVPANPRPLTRVEEKYLEHVFQNVIGVSTKATLEGEHLNQTYGYIGAEQHLRRYPGDVLINHAPESKELGGEWYESEDILRSGIAPGKGAWGYFANSKDKMTAELTETEKWYAVVQTLYLPEWNTRTKYLRDWYKYRKVLIVNIDNGKAVVASIADSGPAAWTGKHYGGSPEVMNYLGGARYKKGPVVLFFVDDPENNIPLGPIEYADR